MNEFAMLLRGEASMKILRILTHLRLEMFMYIDQRKDMIY